VRWKKSDTRKSARYLGKGDILLIWLRFWTFRRHHARFAPRYEDYIWSPKDLPDINLDMKATSVDYTNGR